MSDIFRQAMRAKGIEIKDEILADGSLHRFKVEGDKHNSKNGWYIFYGDSLPAGSFGCFRRDIKETWAEKDSKAFTPSEKAAYSSRMAASQQQRDKEQAKVYDECRVWCSATFEAAKDASKNHPYLIKKGIKPHGIKAFGDSLIIPLRDSSSIIHGLQFINPDGEKRFKAGSSKQGNYFSIGSPVDDTLLISEGFATGASLHEATGYAVAVAFDAGNLLSVAKTLRKKFSDFKIVICADNDISGVGQDKAIEAATAIGGLLAMPSKKPGVDFNDLLRSDGSEAVKLCIESSVIHLETSVNIVEEWEPSIQEWPKIDSRAFYGIAGDFVKLATEKNEADPAAVLMTFLVRFAVEVGSGPTLLIGDTRHKARLASVIVGASSKARKGTSAKPIERLFEPIDGSARYSPGPFSSGEGIIYAVRDQVTKWDEKNQCEVVTDPGLEDKRLFVLDEEFGGAMAQTKREGNTLSMVIRNAWDNGNLDPLTKTNKTTATNAHIGWVSHITTTELHARLNDSEALNGFANRILWVCARRLKIVAFPEPMDDSKLDKIRGRLVEKLNYYKNQDFVKIVFGTDAKKAWVERYYADLTKDNPGLVGCVINRAEAQVVRLSMLFCLLDAQTTITLDHLEAALAVWRYCEASARYIFHGRQTDGASEKILEALATNPLTGTELFALFNNNVTKARLQAALSGLKACGQIIDEIVPSSGRKPKTVWKIINPTNLTNLTNFLNPDPTNLTNLTNFLNPEPKKLVNSLNSLSNCENTAEVPGEECF